MYRTQKSTLIFLSVSSTLLFTQLISCFQILLFLSLSFTLPKSGAFTIPGLPSLCFPRVVLSCILLHRSFFLWLRSSHSVRTAARWASCLLLHSQASVHSADSEGTKGISISRFLLTLQVIFLVFSHLLNLSQLLTFLPFFLCYLHIFTQKTL